MPYNLLWSSSPYLLAKWILANKPICMLHWTVGKLCCCIPSRSIRWSLSKTWKHDGTPLSWCLQKFLVNTTNFLIIANICKHLVIVNICKRLIIATTIALISLLLQNQYLMLISRRKNLWRLKNNSFCRLSQAFEKLWHSILNTNKSAGVISGVFWIWSEWFGAKNSSISPTWT